MTDRPRPSPGRRTRLRTLDSLRLAFSALGIGLIIFGLFTLREASRSRGWATVEGRVVSANVNVFTGKSGTTWRPIVIYSYSVGGIRFMSSRIAFHPVAAADRAGAAKVAAQYPAGRTIPVFYDPRDPEQAVLEPGGNPWVPIIGGGAFSMLAVWMRILRGRAEKRPPPLRG